MNDYLQYWEIFTTVDNFGIGDFGDLAELVLLSQTDNYKSDLFLPIFSCAVRFKKETGHRRKTITNIHNHIPNG